MAEFVRGEHQRATLTDGILELWSGGQSEARFRISDIDAAEVVKGAMGPEVKLRFWPKSSHSVTFEDAAQGGPGRGYRKTTGSIEPR